MSVPKLPFQTSSTLVSVHTANSLKETLTKALVGKRLSEIRTPALIVNRTIVERNSRKLREAIGKLDGVTLRPHIKTHKTVECTEIQLEGFDSVVVSTLVEAHMLVNSHLVSSGKLKDIIYGIPVGIDKLQEVYDLMQKVQRFSVFLDHITTLEAIEEFCKQKQAQNPGLESTVKFSAWLKVDCGYHRAGVPIDKVTSFALAHRLSVSPYINWQGLYSHSGHSYECHSTPDLLAVLHEEKSALLGLQNVLVESGITVPKAISIGATPTASVTANADANSWAGITEVHAGNYVFYDRQQIYTGAAADGVYDCALSVLGRVLSVYPDRGTALIDCGALALSKDITPQGGYGEILGKPDWKLNKISQEHGIIEGVKEEDIAIGNVVRIIPNHACLTSACHEYYIVVDGDENKEFYIDKVVKDVWVPVRGW